MENKKPRHSILIEEEEEIMRVMAENGKDFHEALKGLKSWSFDIFTIRNEDLPKMVERVFQEVGLFEALPQLDAKTFSCFVTSIMGQYHTDVPYHNFRHACDVLHATYLLLTLVEGEKKLNVLEVFALLLAALCHDVDHPGFNNAFLSLSNDPLAIHYNDISILESHHASTTIKTLQESKATNILAVFTEAEQRHIRKLLITIILATDMDQHFKILEMLKLRNSDSRPFEPSPPYSVVGIGDNGRNSLEGTSYMISSSTAMAAVGPSPTSSDDAMVLLKMIMKGADIGNVMKPFFLSKRWAALLLKEWFRQGDAEKKLGLPISKHMDASNPTALQTISMGFIDYIGKPMYEAMAILLPKLHDEVLPNLERNKSDWKSFNSTEST